MGWNLKGELMEFGKGNKHCDQDSDRPKGKEERSKERKKDALNLQKRLKLSQQGISNSDRVQWERDGGFRANNC